MDDNGGGGDDGCNENVGACEDTCTVRKDDNRVDDANACEDACTSH